MRLGRMLGVATAVAWLAAPAQADVAVYYHAGGWDAFDGQNEQGQPFCGVGTRNPADGRTFSVRFELGGNDVIFIASKTGWNIPDHTDIPVVMQVGLERPWPEQATGSGERVQWTMDRTDYARFDAEFRGASSMTVTFPSGNERPWIIALTGSSAVSTAMGRCITGMARRAATAPAPNNGPPPQSTTQPFSAAAPAAAPPAGQQQAQPGGTAGQPGGTAGQPANAQPAPTQPTQPNGAANPSR